MNPGRVESGVRSGHVPRGSGDEPSKVLSLVRSLKCSPRERG